MRAGGRRRCCWPVLVQAIAWCYLRADAAAKCRQMTAVVVELAPCMSAPGAATSCAMPPKSSIFEWALLASIAANGMALSDDFDSAYMVNLD